MITEGEAAIPLETTRCAFLNKEKTKQRSAIVLLGFTSYRAKGLKIFGGSVFTKKLPRI